MQSPLAWFILSVLFASVLTHWWLPIKWCSRKSPRFSLQHSSWKHLNKLQKFCSLMLMNVLDPVLCFIKFQLIFLLLLSSSCSAVVSQSFCVLTASALWEQQIYFKCFILCDKFINGRIKQGLCLRNSVAITLQSSTFLSRWPHCYFSVSHDWFLSFSVLVTLLVSLLHTLQNYRELDFRKFIYLNYIRGKSWLIFDKSLLPSLTGF